MNWFFLVGFMGSGKTTVGAEVAGRLSMPFFDLDELIVREAEGIGIPVIFESEGEEGFRKRETRALRHLLERESGGMVATGGGAYTVEENRDMMHASGVSVWLDVPVSELIARVRGEDRPLWAGEEEARRLAKRRQDYYRLANHRVELAGQSVEEAVERLYDLLAPLCHS